MFSKTVEMRQFHAVCKTIQLIARVRGYKHVMKLFPHEVSHLEICYSLLCKKVEIDNIMLNLSSCHLIKN